MTLAEVCYFTKIGSVLAGTKIPNQECVSGSGYYLAYEQDKNKLCNTSVVFITLNVSAWASRGGMDW